MSDDKFIEVPLSDATRLAGLKNSEQDYVQKIKALEEDKAGLAKQIREKDLKIDATQNQMEIVANNLASQREETYKYKLKWEIERDRFDDLMDKILKRDNGGY